MGDKLRVALLGAIGIVGQRFIVRLANHPWFRLEGLYASREKAGLRFPEAVNWVIDEEMPDSVMDERVRKIDVDDLVAERFDLVFSALPSSIAGEIEVELARRGVKIVSNASPLRLDPHIPLLNPEVNGDHAIMLRKQWDRGWKGWIAKVPNCSTAILTLTLKPIHQAYNITKVNVATMQSVTGAGLTGVPSTLIIDNIIPYIAGEEDKIVKETRKIMGRINRERVEPANFKVNALTTRVPVIDGHLEAVFLEVKKTPQSREEVIEVLKRDEDNYIEPLNLPTAPKQPIQVMNRLDRPQPRLDRKAGGGMSVSVGRIRVDGNGVKMIVLGHNTIRGAAGNGVLIAELIYKLNLFNYYK